MPSKEATALQLSSKADTNLQYVLLMTFIITTTIIIIIIIITIIIITFISQ